MRELIGEPELFRALESVEVEEYIRMRPSWSGSLQIGQAEGRGAFFVQRARKWPAAVLNLGHTIGRALRSGDKYGTFLHGEAVAWGMIAATIAAARSDHG